MVQILVIDDDIDFLGVVSKMLENQGFKVYTAVNGKEGMRLINDTPELNIVVTDLIMPEKEGIEIITELKRFYPQIKILAISGGGIISADNYLQLAAQLGAHSVLKKPFVKQELLSAVNSLMELQD